MCLEHVLYVWQGLLAKNPGWSLIRELATPIRTLGAFPQLSVRTMPHLQAILIVLYCITTNFTLYILWAFGCFNTLKPPTNQGEHLIRDLQAAPRIDPKVKILLFNSWPSFSDKPCTYTESIASGINIRYQYLIYKYPTELILKRRNL